MPAPSLVDLCTKACIKNIRSLNDVGSFEYWMIKTVLQRVDSPEQLHEIEENSPQIKGEDAELWRAFIVRDIPNWRTKNYSPKNPLKWYEVYCKYKREQQEEIKRDEDILRNTMMGLNNHKATHVSKVVDLRSLPKLPRDPRMIANNGGVPLKGRNAFKKQGPSSLMFTAGSRTKITDGKSVLTKARREAKEISAMGKLAKPTHQLSGRLGQVKKAPAAMATEHKIANQPAIKILSSRKHHLPLGQFEGGISGPSLEERENRLRAMQSRTRTEPPLEATNETLVGSSDDEMPGDLFDDDEEEDDEPQYRAPAPSSRNHSSQSSRLSSSRPHQASSSPPARPLARSTGMLASKHKPISSSNTTPSTASPAASTPRPMMKRRANVDVFNRGGKKPRR